MAKPESPIESMNYWVFLQNRVICKQEILIYEAAGASQLFQNKYLV